MFAVIMCPWRMRKVKASAQNKQKKETSRNGPEIIQWATIQLQE